MGQEADLPEPRPHLSGQGHQRPPPQGLGASGKGPVGEGQGSEDKGTLYHPQPGHLTPLTGLCRQGFSGAGSSPAAFSASFRSVRVTPWQGRGQSGALGL